MKSFLPEILMSVSFLSYYKYMIDGFMLLSIGVVIFMNIYISLIFILLSYALNYTSFLTFCVLTIIAVSVKPYDDPDECYNYYNKQNERASRHFRNCKEGQTVLSYYYETGDGQTIFTYYRRENGNMKKRMGVEKTEDFDAIKWDYESKR